MNYIKQAPRKTKKEAAKQWCKNLRRIFFMTLAMSMLIVAVAIFAATDDGGYIFDSPCEFEASYENTYLYSNNYDSQSFRCYENDYHNYYPQYEFDNYPWNEYTQPAEEAYDYERGYVNEVPAYIEIMPLSYTLWPTIVTHPDQLQTQINAVPANGVPHRIRLQFGGNHVVTTGTQIPTITITGNRHIILDGNNGIHQRWNRDQTSGRHFHVAEGATLELWNVSIARSAGFGPNVMSGGIYVYGGVGTRRSTLILNHSNARIAYNRTNHAGGGVFVNIGGRLYLHNGSIDSNASFVNYELVPPDHGDGGGVMIQFNSYFEMTGGRIHNNESRVSGAGVFLLFGSEFRMVGGFIENNRATGDGGGVVINADSTGIMYNGRIRNNSADIRMLNNAPRNGWGGGVLVFGNNSHFTMHNGHIYGNRTYHGGGGVWISDGTNSSFTMHGGVIWGNRYRPTRVGANVPIPQGGGIWLNGAGNYVRLYGGTIGHATDNALGNQAGEGAGVRVSGGARLYMLGSTVRIARNYATYFAGGGVMITGGEAASSSTFTMTSGVIEHNTGHHGWSPQITSGGGVYVSAGGEFIMRLPQAGEPGHNNAGHPQPIIQNNNADQGGAGVGVMGYRTVNANIVPSRFVMHTGVIRNNHTAFSGGFAGGLYLNNGAVGYMHGGEIYGNRGWWGGGVNIGAYVPTQDGSSIINPSTFTMTNGIIRNNFTRGSTTTGGGVHASDYVTFNMSGGVIHSNNINSPAGYGQGNGGGVAVHGPYTVFNMSGTAAIRNNAANAGNGGGVWVNGGLFNMSGGSIGGAIGSSNPAQNGNHAVSGGGIFATAGATINMTNANARVYGNTATNTAVSGGGGGVFITGESTHLNLQNGIISGNRATRGGGVMLVTGNATAVNPARLTIEGGIIQNNRVNHTNGVTLEGGGVFATGANAVFNMSGGLIGNHNRNEGNQAVRGGGVFISAGAAFNMQATSASGALIFGNTATGTAIGDGGGGVFLSSSGSQINIAGGTIGHTSVASGNHAGRGGGIFVTSGAIVNMTNINAVIRGNTALETAVSGGGGGVFITGAGARLNLENGLIELNRATRGGGVYIASGTAANRSWLNVTGGAIRNNRVDHNNTPILEGGGVYITGANAQFNMTGGDLGTITTNGNRAQSGGAVFVTVGAWFELAGGIIRGNEANHGGGVFVTGINAAGNIAPLFTMTSGFIGGSATNQGNAATAAADGSGGGVRIQTSGRFSFTGGIIQGNRANRGAGISSGGIAAAAASVLLHEYDEWIDEDYHFGSYIGIVPMNIPIRPPQPANTIVMSGNAQIISNTATNYGGGMHISGGIVNMPSGNPVISNNTVTGTAAGHGGGGVFVTGLGSILNFNAGIINQNRAIRGGGVMLNAGNATVASPARVTMAGSGDTFGSIISNRVNHLGTAITEGGGVFVSGANAQFNMSSGTIGFLGGAGNQAVRGGGVFLTDGAVFNMTTSVPVIMANTATGIASGDGGGGVFLTGTNTQFNMYGGTIGGTFIDATNSAHNGGGIFVHGGTANLTPAGGASVLINNNQANALGSGSVNGGGGGIYVALNGQLIANGASIINNRAPNGMGGGIFTENHEYERNLTLAPVPGFPRYSNLTLTNIIFTNNTALSVYEPPTNAATVLPGPFVSTSPPSGTPYAAHPLNNRDINFRADPLIEVSFEFIKTDNVLSPHLGTCLQGAGFQLSWRPDQATAWEPISAPIFSNAQGVVQLILSPEGQYRLIETAPPPGFQAPLGYWIIVVSEVSGSYVVTAVNNHASNPIFTQHGGSWWVGNRADFELPLTGGMGTTVFFVSGSILIGLAILITVMFIAISVKKATSHLI
ncbi:MAG: hypothetical protein FWE11_01190 [Defluviitaleaceae bacterium]|nr:hypothetical protein [Defluviitaleaceae bacterium]